MATPSPSPALLLVSALMWSVSSSSIIVMNKKIMGEEPTGLGFFFPLTIAFMGSAASAVLATTLLGLMKMVRVEKKKKKKTKKTMGKRNDDVETGVSWQWEEAVEALAVSLCFATTLCFGNAAYETLSVSFVQMLKSATPLVTLFVSTIIDFAEKKGIGKLKAGAYVR